MIMKRILILFTIFVLGTANSILAQNIVPTITDEELVKNCSSSLSTLIKMADQQIQLPFNPYEIADTLYDKLYANPRDISTTAKYIGKLPLCAFFAITNDKRIDYSDIEKCLAITYKYPAFHTFDFLVCATYYAIWADKQGYANKAIGASERALVVADKLFPKDSITFWKQSVLVIAMSNSFAKKEWKQTAKCQKELLRLEELTNGNDTPGYYEGLKNLAFCYKITGKTVAADSCMVIIQDYMKRHNLDRSEDYAELLIDRLDVLAKSRQYYQCKLILRDLLSFTKQSDDWYMDVIHAGVSYYTEIQDYTEALTYFKKGVDSLKKDKNITPAEIYPWIVYGNIPNSSNEIEELINLLEKLKREDDVVSLATLSYAYSKKGNFDKASAMCKKADSLFKTMSTEAQESVIDNVIGMYEAMNDFDKQIEVISKQISNTEKTLGKENPILLSYKKMQASIYNIKGEYYKSEAILDSCLNSNVASIDELLDIYEEKAYVYLGTGDYSRAFRLAEKLMKYAEDPVMKFNLYNVIITSLTSELDITNNDVTERASNTNKGLNELLKDYSEQMLEFTKRVYGDGHINTITALEMAGTAAYFNNDISQMLQYAQEAEAQINKHFTNKELAKTYIEGLSILYIYGGDYQKALSLIDKDCINNEYSFFLEKSTSYELLSEVYQRMGNYATAQEYYQQLANLLMTETSTQMNSLTSQARQNYWRRYRQTLNNAGKYVSIMGTPNEFAGTVYNLALFSKSLLLNSDASFQKAILRTGDNSLLHQFGLLKTINSQLSSNPIIDSEKYRKLKVQSILLEKELISAVKEYRQLSDYQSAKWHDIQNALEDNSIAVELIEYITSDEKAHYGASIIRKGWDYPVFVEVGEKRKTEKQLNELFYDDTAAKAAWSYLLPYLEGIRTINISVAGCFHKTPIENLSLDGEKTMAELYIVNRLSSTAELLHNTYENGAASVAYGGMQYKNLSKLVGSKEEADEIVDIIKKTKTNALGSRVYTGYDATKDSFIGLSAQKNEYLHISTHGYYHENSDDNLNAPSFVYVSNKEDASLMRSGLYFSNDEQLTAYDISLLDLSGLDVVSLSACQTGLGDISGDGVFGLQRGFKKAGAKSILMSLWPVANEPTKALMTSFYKNLITGKCKSKAEALELAKMEIKGNPVWQSPDHWAGFILLDGIK